jgi:hypothetical protein
MGHPAGALCLQLQRLQYLGFKSAGTANAAMIELKRQLQKVHKQNSKGYGEQRAEILAEVSGPFLCLPEHVHVHGGTGKAGKRT